MRPGLRRTVRIDRPALKDGAESRERPKICFQHAGFSPVPPRIPVGTPSWGVRFV